MIGKMKIYGYVDGNSVIISNLFGTSLGIIYICICNGKT